MMLSGWGQYPVIEAEPITPLTTSELQSSLVCKTGFAGIARGMGRSYGDSALSPKFINTLYLNHIQDFDESTGIICCAAGVTLDDILQVFVPRGWFLPVTPGTKFVTVGGAIASDVHGKNHHIVGCFSDHLDSIRVILANGEIINCSRSENTELFHATCGGMGLTGIILTATLRLKKISSAYINETIIKTSNLEETLSLFSEHENSTYSVAWIDCLASGKSLGRSLLMLGEHAEDAGLDIRSKRCLSVPVNMPRFLLNRYSIRAFNALYYNQLREVRQERIVHYEPFFYPLDSIHHWNRIYGKPGFTQYQFVIPRDAGFEGMHTIMQKIASSGMGSFLAILKAFGKSNNNLLSFPIDGYTLALDFKLGNGVFDLLEELDKVVLAYGGRLYLSKDARMCEQTFKQGYPRWKEFKKIRQDYGADKVFYSLQSNRLGI